MVYSNGDPVKDPNMTSFIVPSIKSPLVDFYGYKDVKCELSSLGIKLRYFGELVLGYKIGYIDGKIIGFTLCTAYGIKFGINERTELVYLIISNCVLFVYLKM